MKENEVEIVVKTKPDKEGKQNFVIAWKSIYTYDEFGKSDNSGILRIRYQHFNANLKDHVNKWKDRGYMVSIASSYYLGEHL